MQNNMSVVSIAWVKKLKYCLCTIYTKKHFFFTAELRYVPSKTKLVKCSDTFMSLIGLGSYGFLLFVLCFQVVGSFSVIKYSADTLEPLSL